MVNVSLVPVLRVPPGQASLVRAVPVHNLAQLRRKVLEYALRIVPGQSVQV